MRVGGFLQAVSGHLVLQTDQLDAVRTRDLWRVTAGRNHGNTGAGTESVLPPISRSNYAGRSSVLCHPLDVFQGLTSDLASDGLMSAATAQLRGHSVH